MSLCAAAADESLVGAGQKHVKTVLDRPLSDLNVMRPGVTAALQKAARAPYAPPDARCEVITEEIMQLDTALGPDLDARNTAARTKTMPSVSELEGEAAGSFIPYEGVLRFFTGADKRDRKLAAMVLAGAVRRAYLKGTGEARGCASAAPVRVKAAGN